MGLLSSFNIGITGLSASGDSTAVISDNIANAGTTGFKSSRAEFQNVLASSLSGIAGDDQIGMGTRMSHVKQIFNQGDVARTENITDLAISGDGFFIINANFGRGFSRDGSLHFNKDGKLVTSDEYSIMGFAADQNGRITTKLEPIKLRGSTIPAKKTTRVDVQMNINSIEKITEFDLDKPYESAQFAHTVTAYDNVGIPRILTLLYNKIDDNYWEYRVMVEGKDVKKGKEGDPPVEMGNGTLIFDENGNLEEEVEGENSFTFNSGAEAKQKIEFNWGESIVEGGSGINASTQYGSNTNITRHSQDGFSAATLSSLSLDNEGVLSAIYDNGEIQDIAQLALGKFDNNEGLFKVGQNLFKESKKSGESNIGKPGTGGRGQILSRSIELSNVDIANEFVSLLNAQRNFTANAKVLKTTNEMLDEILKIK